MSANMSSMKIRIGRSAKNPARPFLVEILGADGKWAPFGNEESHEAAGKAVDMLAEMYGFVKEES